jgi:hypothetical protein
MKNAFLYDINKPKNQHHPEDIRSMYGVHCNVCFNALKRIYIFSLSPSPFIYFFSSSACVRGEVVVVLLQSGRRKKEKKDLHIFFLSLSLIFRLVYKQIVATSSTRFEQL